MATGTTDYSQTPIEHAKEAMARHSTIGATPMIPIRHVLGEYLSAYAHQAWAGWMRYLFALSTKNADGTITIPAELVERWERQARTDYLNLPDKEKDSNRIEAERMMQITEQHLDRVGLIKL